MEATWNCQPLPYSLGAGLMGILGALDGEARLAGSKASKIGGAESLHRITRKRSVRFQVVSVWRVTYYHVQSVPPNLQFTDSQSYPTKTTPLCKFHGWLTRSSLSRVGFARPRVSHSCARV